MGGLLTHEDHWKWIYTVPVYTRAVPCVLGCPSLRRFVVGMSTDEVLPPAVHPASPVSMKL